MFQIRSCFWTFLTWKLEFLCEWIRKKTIHNKSYLFNKVREIHVWSVSSLNTTTGNNEKVVKKNVSEKDSRNNKSSDVNRDTDANILMCEYCINREESRECMYFRCNCAEFVSWRALHGSSINLFRTTCIKCWRIMDSI